MIIDELTAPLDGEEDATEQLDLPTIKLSRNVVTPSEPEPSEITIELTKDVLPIELRQRALPFMDESAARAPVVVSTIAISTIAQSTMGQSGIAHSAIGQSVGAITAPTMGESAVAKSSVSDPVAEEVLSIASLDVARVATLAGRIASGLAESALAVYGLNLERWRRIEQEWTARIASEIERGETASRDAYDDAYLAARAAHRGSFGLAAFAELRVEIEARIADESNEGLAMDIADAMRFQRAWARKVLLDPSLGRALEEALEDARTRMARR